MSTRIAMVGHVDHGKSTLIGRLLSDTQQTRTERTARVQSLCESTGRKFEYAFLLDTLEEEQSQGVTIDVTEVNWSHEGLEYIFVDTPGHREFLKKMIGGASRVEAAVLILDVSEGIKEFLRRQMIVLDLLGVNRRIIVANKMDLVEWNKETWLEREKEIRSMLPANGEECWIIPASAWHGANLLAASPMMPWYTGPSFAEALRAVSKRQPVKSGPARFFVQDVLRMEDKRIYTGRVESGTIAVGDCLVFHPGKLQSRVRSIEAYGEIRSVAVVGDAVGITLDDPLFLDRGFLGFKPEEKPSISNLVRGDLFWLDSQAIKAGDRLKIKMGTRTGFAVVEKIEHEIDGQTFVEVRDSEKLSMFGRVVFRFDEPWAFDAFQDCEPTGRFVVSRSGQVLGGGRWVSEASLSGSSPQGSVLWFTGLSGAGKSTLARALKQELEANDEQVIVLDGDKFRSGLCADLGFCDADRRENMRRAAHVAKLLCDEGFTVITAFISPLAEMRSLARKIIGPSRFKEIFVDCPLQICEARDVKGLYAKARRGELPEFTGLSSPFEIPLNPDVHLRTNEGGVLETIQQLRNTLRKG